MKQKHDLGTPALPERTDHEGSGIPDQFEFDFNEAGHKQPPAPDPHPDRRPPSRQRHDHAS